MYTCTCMCMYICICVLLHVLACNYMYNVHTKCYGFESHFFLSFYISWNIMHLQVFFNTEKHPQLHYNHDSFHIIKSLYRCLDKMCCLHDRKQGIKVLTVTVLECSDIHICTMLKGYKFDWKWVYMYFDLFWPDIQCRIRIIRYCEVSGIIMGLVLSDDCLIHIRTCTLTVPQLLIVWLSTYQMTVEACFLLDIGKLVDIT